MNQYQVDADGHLTIDTSDTNTEGDYTVTIQMIGTDGQAVLDTQTIALRLTDNPCVADLVFPNA